MTETLSVILPVHNGEQFVLKAIESVFAQQGHPFGIELIVVDDASTDGSLALLQKQALLDQRIKVFPLHQNQGIGAARAFGVEKAKGDWLAFIDQDDQWLSEKLCSQYQALTEDSSLSYLLGYQSFNCEDLSNLPSWFRAQWAQSPQRGFVFGTILIRRNDFLKVGLTNAQYRFGVDDVDWFARAKQLGLKEKMLEAVLLERRVHAANTSSKAQLHNEELLDVIRQKINRGKTSVA